MDKSYQKRFQMFSESLSDSELVNYARKNGTNTFSRKRKMPLKDILLCCFPKKGLTTAFELRKYFKDNGELPMRLSVQGYLQQRKRLNPEVFPYLSHRYLMDFYHSDEPMLWKGYLLVAIDGSKAEVLNSKENRETFGNSGSQHSKMGQVRVLVSGMYDILNHFYMDIEVEHISVSENELAKRNIKHLREMGIKQPVLAIFDRRYPSIELIDFLETEGIHCLIRLSSNDYTARLQKIRQKHPGRYEHMKKKGKTAVRMSRSMLPSENELALVTDLLATVTSTRMFGRRF